MSFALPVPTTIKRKPAPKSIPSLNWRPSSFVVIVSSSFRTTAQQPRSTSALECPHYYVYFADKINVPVLILQGGADWRSNAGSQALGLATRLQSLGKTYELHLYVGDDHPLSIPRDV